jgi:histidinol dehydrogenase
MTKNPYKIMENIENAGAIFIGNYSPESLGDYIAGPNHVLPTGGTSRFSSPLGVDDFIKKSNIIHFTKNGLKNFKDDIILLTELEGLDAHANSVKCRF